MQHDIYPSMLQLIGLDRLRCPSFVITRALVMRSLFVILLTVYAVTVYSYPEPKFSLHRRETDIKAASPFDHTWIEAYAAIGDSFGVGLGAGHSIKPSDRVELNTACYQYSYGYPNIINAASGLGLSNTRRFQWLACSGAKMPDILSNQVPRLKSPQLVTISGGGNDADLANVLNYCVYQWSAIFLWSCEGILADARAKIEHESFSKNMDTLLTAVKGRLNHPSNRIYWIGYARFWDVSTSECDQTTWGTLGFRGAYLTRERRSTMNDLVDLVNDKIKAAVTRAGSQTVFVDWQPGVSFIKGRFCEPGVDETYAGGKGPAINRERAVFYKWGTTKDDDDKEDKGHDELLVNVFGQPEMNNNNDTFEGRVANFVREGKAENATAMAELMPLVEITGSLLPDRYGRVFHPTKYGNSIIAKNVIDAITEEQAKLMNRPAVTTIISCRFAAAETLAPTPSPPPAPAPTAPYEEGKCSLHLQQWDNYKAVRHGPRYGPGYGAAVYSVAVTVYDAKKKEIGKVDRTDAQEGSPLELKSMLEDVLVITPDQGDDSIEFELGAQDWKSNYDIETLGTDCSVGGWDYGIVSFGIAVDAVGRGHANSLAGSTDGLQLPMPVARRKIVEFVRWLTKTDVFITPSSLPGHRTKQYGVAEGTRTRRRD
ncbi:MAG: hypothetical protein M1817_003675 [Caeruleum heppii]|nr:MAG: hypothetical protein M1817_003675 [Caeruleum heppii]